MPLKISLKAARVNAGLTQEQAAQAVGRSKQTIINWESGATNMKVSDMMLLSQIYQMPMEYLDIPLKNQGSNGGLL